MSELLINTENKRRTWVRVSSNSDNSSLWLNNNFIDLQPDHIQQRILEIPFSDEPQSLRTDDNKAHFNIFTTGPVRLTRQKFLSYVRSSELISIELQLELDSECSLYANIITLLVDNGSEHIKQVALSKGRNRIHVNFDVEHLQIWSPENPHTYEIEIQIQSNQNEKSDEWRFLTGFAPKQSLKTLKRAPIVTLECIAENLLYEKYDKIGTVIAQELPEDLNLARQMVDFLSIHPSIGGWFRTIPRTKIWRKPIDTHREIIQRADPTRPYWASSL